MVLYYIAGNNISRVKYIMLELLDVTYLMFNNKHKNKNKFINKASQYTDADTVDQTQADREPQRANDSRVALLGRQKFPPPPALPELCLRHASLLHPLLSPWC